MARKRPAPPPAPPEPVDDVYSRYNVFRPGDGGLRKHPCQDCAFCQFCSDSRCDQCLRQKRSSGNAPTATPGNRLAPLQQGEDAAKPNVATIVRAVPMAIPGPVPEVDQDREAEPSEPRRDVHTAPPGKESMAPSQTLAGGKKPKVSGRARKPAVIPPDLPTDLSPKACATPKTRRTPSRPLKSIPALAPLPNPGQQPTSATVPPTASPNPVPSRLTPLDITRGTVFLKKADPVLGKLIRRVGPCRLEFEGMQSPFQALLEGIVYQQLTGKAAATIFGRVRALLAPRGAIRPLDIVRATDEDLRACGLSGPKIAAIRDLAEKTQAGVVPDAAGLEALPDEEVITRLTAVRGIGRWTAEMLLIFRLGRPDVLSTGDYGLRKGFAALFHPDRLPTPKELGAHGERWSPFRTIASWYLWRASETFGNRKTK